GQDVTEPIRAAETAEHAPVSQQFNLSAAAARFCSPEGLRYAPTLRQHSRDDALSGFQHLVDLFGLLAACFGEIGASAAPAADDRGDFLHDLAGFHFCDQVGRDGDDDLDLAIVG